MTASREPHEPDYSRWTIDRLQQQLEAVKSSLGLLQREFGGWKGYRWAERLLRENPESKGWDEVEMPDHMHQVRRLELERKAIVLELSKRSADDSKSTRERIARNIDTLRKECGWSFDMLAERTGIDKKAILSHVRAKSRPNPKTLREYAQAFSKELHKSITANNLEEPV